jgi:hypothetical protein
MAMQQHNTFVDLLRSDEVTRHALVRTVDADWVGPRQSIYLAWTSKRNLTDQIEHMTDSAFFNA